MKLTNYSLNEETEQPTFSMMFWNEYKKYISSRQAVTLDYTEISIMSVYNLTNQFQENQQIRLKATEKQQEIQFVIYRQIKQFKLNEFKDGLIRLTNNFNIRAQTSNSKICLNFANNIIEAHLYLAETVSLTEANWNFANHIKNQIEKHEHNTANFIQQIRKNIKIKPESADKPKKLLVQLVNQFDIIKNTIDAQIRKRNKNTLPPLIQHQLDQNRLNFPNLEIQSEVPKKRIYDSLNQIESLEKKKKNDKEKDYQSKIVRKIELIESNVDQNWEEPKSSFGKILKLKATYKIEDLSINQMTNQLINQNDERKRQKESLQYCSSTQGKIFSGQLIEKSVKILQGGKKTMAKASFMTEIQILKYLRNFSFNNIASYYMKQIPNNNQFVDRFYSDFYPKSLKNKYDTIRLQKALYVLKHIAQGLKFMHSVSLLHRDLKPENIMLTEKFVPKLIDFGSSIFFNIPIPENICKILKTTKGYNLWHDNLPDEKVITRKEFEEHQYYDIHAFGVIFRQLLLQKQHSSSFGPFRKNLQWLHCRCIDINPYNRISPLGLSLVMKRLLKHYNIKNSK